MKFLVTSAVLLVGECTGRRSSLPSRVVESRTLFSRVLRGIEKMSGALKEFATNTGEGCSMWELSLFGSVQQETSI